MATTVKSRFFCTVFILIVLLAVPSPSYSFDEETFVSHYFWQKFTKLSPPRRPKIALVLGGGGARGLAHIGVLKVLDEEKVPVDIVVGTSVGALVGSLYAAGVPLQKIEKLGENIGWNDLSDITETGIIKMLLTGHLLSTEKMEKFIAENIGPKRFDELEKPFACVATDLVTGERIVFREGEIGPAVRASSTIPGIFDPVEYRHRYLVDGGLLDNIPVDIARMMGADIIVAVVVSADFSRNDVSNVYMVLVQAIYIQGKAMDVERMHEADFVIKPNVSGVSAVDLGHSSECIDGGVVATRRVVAELKNLLMERTSDCYLFR